MDAAAAQALLKGACLQQASPADKIMQATERAGYLDIAGLNLQFDRGHLAVFNPLRLLCDSGESAGFDWLSRYLGQPQRG